MAFLEKFPEADREILTSLPYRAGLWVSSSDKTGEPLAQDKETLTLDNIITQKAQGMFESAFVHEVMADLCARRGNWKDLAKDIDKVPAECGKAVELMSAQLDRRDIDAYRQNVMYIGVEVAKAFREFDITASFFVRLWTAVKLALDGMIGAVRGVTYEEESLLNISYAEDVALAKLAEALGVDAQTDSLADEIKSPGA